MGQTTWTGTQLGYTLSGCRLDSGKLLLAFNEFTPDANTLALWHMNEGAGSTVADATGNYPITLSAANWQSNSWMGNGLAGNAAGTSNPAIPLNGLNDYTVECWMHVSSNPVSFAYWELIACRTAWNRNNVLLTLRATANFFVALRTYDSVGNSVSCDYSSNTWVGGVKHVAAVRNGNTLRLYQNGVQVNAVNALTGAHNNATQTLISASAIAEAVGQDELRISSVCRYPNGATFSPTRYPTSGIGTTDPATAITGKPGLLTVTLSEALPAGTSVKAKLLSTTGGDTGFQTLTGSGTSYTYDFTGQAGGNWYPAVQLFAGGALNANTPTVTQAALDWTVPVYPRRGGGGTTARLGPSLVRWCL